MIPREQHTSLGDLLNSLQLLSFLRHATQFDPATDKIDKLMIKEPIGKRAEVAVSANVDRI